MATTPTPAPTNSTANISAIISEVGGIANGILTTIATVDPTAALPVAVIAEIEKLATQALAAWTAAKNTAITVESVQALLPNAAPLSAPTS